MQKAIILLLIGIGSLYLTYVLYQREEQFYGRALYAEGHITDFVKRTHRGDYVFVPKVQFTDASGSIVTFVSNLESRTPAYEKGQAVRVAYRRDDPTHAEIDTFFARWGSLLIAGAMGILFTLLGIVVLVSRRSNPGASPPAAAQ